MRAYHDEMALCGTRKSSSEDGRRCRIMEQKAIRLLRANEIECRVGTISEKGVSLLHIRTPDAI